VTRIIPIVVVLAFAACSKSAPAAASSQTETTPAPQQAAPAAPAAPAAAEPVKPVAAQLPEIVARVNGEAINRGDLEEAVGEIEARAGQPMPADQRDRVLRAVLDNRLYVITHPEGLEPLRRRFARMEKAIEESQ
jgi:hypothetical protein